jgi:hypothetical protein
MPSLESLSKFMSPPPAHTSNSNLNIDQNIGKQDHRTLTFVCLMMK